MKALSILQPWASLCVTTDPKTGKAYKQIETRSWNTKFRGQLLIHASKRWDRELNDTVGQIGADGILKLHGYHSEGIRNGKLITNLPLGAIIGMVNLVDTMNTERIILPPNESKYRSIIADPWKITDQELAFGDYSEKRFGWLLSDPIMFKNPIPCKGSLSIWNLPGELEEAVQEQIRMATALSVLLATPGEGAVVVEPAQPNIECVYSCIQCDNPACDYRDDTVTADQWESFIGKPCPKCGENLMTEEDLKNAMNLIHAEEFMNSLTQEQLIQLHEELGSPSIDDMKNHPMIKGAEGLDLLNSMDQQVVLKYNTHKEIKLESVVPVTTPSDPNQSIWDEFLKK